jgi:hypothetical protein
MDKEIIKKIETEVLPSCYLCASVKELWAHYFTLYNRPTARPLKVAICEECQSKYSNDELDKILRDKIRPIIRKG